MVIRQMFQDYRQAHNFTFADLSSRTGIDDATLCRFEKGNPIEESNWLKLLAFFFSSSKDSLNDSSKHRSDEDTSPKKSTPNSTRPKTVQV